ncbi:hypothetical protein ElyMa_003442100 [Elysia marginata]|uniref:Uncharacterized protein n=1 Tax=Elysia marginata TaxID=1093978 RepID=A0AAV4JUP1_9GAST|nr:hypothetical protein ElyMa_003442100 [Elysia marginata]
MLYSGHEEEDANHTEGEGLMLSRQAAKSVLRWQPERSRIISAMFKTNKKKINLLVIKCYPPTNEKGEDVTEQFYARFQDVLEKSKAKGFTILMEGGLYAQIENGNTGYEEI